MNIIFYVTNSNMLTYVCGSGGSDGHAAPRQYHRTPQNTKPKRRQCPHSNITFTGQIKLVVCAKSLLECSEFYFEINKNNRPSSTIKKTI